MTASAKSWSETELLGGQLMMTTVLERKEICASCYPCKVCALTYRHPYRDVLLEALIPGE